MALLSLSFISAVNPWLLAGAVAIASPIIIHLLSRRKFQVVYWAAMDFLLNAEKRNRRRIRLEHLLLLILRCLAIILIAMLVARLFFTQSGLAAMLGQTARTERIVLLDDSPSTTLQSEARDVLADSKQALIRFVREVASERSGDELTLYLTSNPEQPVINGRLFREQETLVRLIERIEPADVAANLDRALLALEEHIADADEQGSGAINRLVYLISDMRQRDWEPAADLPEDRAIANLLHRLGEATDGVLVVDVEAGMAENLTLSDIAPTAKTLVTGVPVEFEVAVFNHGNNEARDVEVTFNVADGPPQTGYIDVIPAGQEGVATFTTTFAQAGDVPVAANLPPDPLPADNQRDYIARLQEGVQVLLVDGDPSSDPYRSETYVLERAVSPDEGETSGNRVTVVTEDQFEGQNLEDYQVVMLANVYDLPDERLVDLTRWVAGGGGLVFFLGDQVDPALYNERLHRDGAGLMPMRLTEVLGDETERTFANVGRVLGNHPITQKLRGADDPLVKFSKFFRWYHSTLPEPLPGEDQAASQPRVVMALNNDQRSPLMVEKTLGTGRVMAVTSSADGDWTNWPAKEGFLITMLELVQYMARTPEDTWNVQVGTPVVQQLPIDTYRREARIWPPGAEEPTTIQAVTRVDQQPPEVSVGLPESDTAPDAGLDLPEPDDQTLDGMPTLELRYDRTSQAGIYRAQLLRHDGGTDEARFAVSIDPTEGDLAPTDRAELREKLGESKVELLTTGQALEAGSAGGRREMWRTIAFLLIGVLCLEQFLAWSFGRRR